MMFEAVGSIANEATPSYVKFVGCHVSPPSVLLRIPIPEALPAYIVPEIERSIANGPPGPPLGVSARQVAPASVLLKNPAASYGHAYIVVGVQGAISNVPICLSVSSLELQLAPPSTLLSTPPSLPAYTVVG